MIYNKQDPMLNDIFAIKNLEFIKFYDLSLSGDKESEKKTMMVPALVISYNGGTIMNLSMMDKHFDTFVNKVLEVYNEEKNREVDDDPFDTSKIDIDEHSQKILDNCDIVNKSIYTERYENMDSYDNSMMFECDEIRNIIDIVRYEIKSFGEFANLNINLLDGIRGYRTNYILEANINDIFTYLLVHYDKIDENNYEISIGNMGGINKSFNIRIKFADDQINVTSVYNDILFDDTFKINVENDNATYIKRIKRGEEILKFETGDLSQSSPVERNLVNLDCVMYDGVKWYALPWRAYFGYISSINEIEEGTKVFDDRIIYLDINDNDFYKREFISKKVKRNNTISRIGVKLTLDELRKVTFGYMRRPYYVIETSFKNARGNGKYQEKFNGKYYYHVVKAKNINEVDGNRLVAVRKEIVNDKADLLSDVNLKVLGGRH